MIEANEKHRTNHPAFVFGDAVLTHGEFAKRARTLSSALYRVGCRKQDRVAHLTQNRIEQCEIYGAGELAGFIRSEEHTSELQSLMRISYAVFCFKKKQTNKSNEY